MSDVDTVAVASRRLLPVGAKIKFMSEKAPYTVRAANERYAVCIKPFNLKRTVLYTIIDFHEYVRGTENLIFGAGFETDEDCHKALARLTAGETRVSRRNYVPLDIEEVVHNES